MSTPPNIRFPHLASIPDGYVLGRVSSGTGDVELIDFATLTQGVLATGAVSTPGSTPMGSAPNGMLPLMTGALPGAAGLMTDEYGQCIGVAL